MAVVDVVSVDKRMVKHEVVDDAGFVRDVEGSVDLTIPQEVRVFELEELDLEFMQRLARAPGLSYLNIFKPAYRNVVFQALGVSPTWVEMREYVRTCVGTVAVEFSVFPYLVIASVAGEFFTILVRPEADYETGSAVAATLLSSEPAVAERELWQCVGDPDYRSVGTFDNAWKGTAFLDPAPRESVVVEEVHEAMEVASDGLKEVVDLPVKVRISEDADLQGWPPQIVEYARSVVERYGLADLAECAESVDGKGVYKGSTGYPFPYDLASRNGFCYLHLFARAARPRVAMALGSYPKVQHVYQLYVAALVFSFMGTSAIEVDSSDDVFHVLDKVGDWRQTLVVMAAHCLEGATRRMGGKVVTVVEPEPDPSTLRRRRRMAAYDEGYWIAYTGWEEGGEMLQDKVKRLRRGSTYRYHHKTPFVLEVHAGAHVGLPDGVVVEPSGTPVFVLCKCYVRVEVFATGPLGVRIAAYAPDQRGQAWFNSLLARCACAVTEWWLFAGPRVTQESPLLEPISDCWCLEKCQDPLACRVVKSGCRFCGIQGWRARDVPYTVLPEGTSCAMLTQVVSDYYLGCVRIPRLLDISVSVAGVPMRLVSGAGPVSWVALAVADAEKVDYSVDSD